MKRLISSIKFTFTIVVFSAPIIVRAQNVANDYVVPPSPEAAALGKYAQIPVSIYTGSPRIEIPIWEVNEGDITVPVNFSYHSSGHRVDEVAPRTGMGWTLNAGGVITRTIMGEADEYGTGGFLQFSQGYAPTTVLQGSNEEKYYRYEHLVECGDAEPDQFSFNFNGYSGKFAFNWNRQIMVSAEKDIKIEPINLTPGAHAFISGWRVTTEDGMVYMFEAKETTHLTSNFDLLYPCFYKDSNGNNIQPVTSWFLTAIASPNGSKVFFHYEPYTLSHRIRVSETTSHKSGWSAATTQARNETITVKGQYLRTITTLSGNTLIEFIPSNVARTDIPGNGTTRSTLYSLAEIKVSAGEDNPVKKFKMSYDYSIGRLTLKQIREHSANDAMAKPSYEFTYQGTLPQFNIDYAGAFFSQDHWGYFNGAYNNQLTPPYAATNAAGQRYIYPGANREPTERGVSGLLSSIRYPTGGTTTFQFESHDYSFVDTEPLLIPDIIERGPVSVEHSAKNSGSSYDSRRTLSVPFTLKPRYGNPGGTIPLIYNVQLSYCSSPGFGGALIGPRISLLDANKNTIRSWNHTPNASSYNDTLHLPPGQYYLEAFAQNTPQCTIEQNGVIIPLGWDHAWGSVHWLEFSAPKRKAKLAGGARIKKITDSDGINPANNIVRIYEYKVDEDSVRVSSGVLQHNPRYHYEMSVYEQYGITSYVVRYANSVVPLSLTQGNPVGYKAVTVYNGEHYGGGKTAYHYTTFGDNTIPRNDVVSFETPFPPSIQRDYLRGLLTKQIDYEFSNGEFKPVRQIDNTYIDNDGNIDVTSIFALKVGEKCVGCRTGGLSGRGLQMDWQYFALGKYSINLATSRLSGSKETLFTSNGNIVSEASYTFDIGLKWLLNETTRTSEGAQLRTEYAYPFHYAAGPFTQLTARHILSPIIEKTTFKRSSDGSEKVVAATFVDYMDHGGKLLPSSKLEFSSTQPVGDFAKSVSNSGLPDNRYYRVMSVFDRYNSIGKIEQLTTVGHVTTSYLWGYQNSLVLAEIQNASVDQCAFAGFETSDKGNWEYADDPGNYSSDARTGTRSFMGNMSLAGARQGRYTVTLWAKSSSDSGSVSVNDQVRNVDATWKLHTWTVTDPQSIQVVVNAVMLDDVRFLPETAMMKTFSYTRSRDVGSITDENNQITFYTYDALLKLTTIRDQWGNILKHHQYKYKRD